jgi:NAD(P)-dependent dehydrogenase (short-subunit alcohol dehydrogenase family)
LTASSPPWALILGASSGFGEATALEFARAGFDILGVHLDRRQGLAHVADIESEIRGLGRQAHFFNVNAADAERRRETLRAAIDLCDGRAVRVFLHSLAFGTLKPFFADDEREGLGQQQLEMTLDVMANSIVYWSQDLVRAGLLRRGSKIFGMTSAGDRVVWKAYGAVSAAKCALESHIRQLAVELAPLGISANAIKAGVTDTPALRKIPGNETIVASAEARNPSGRLTTPQDVARCLLALSAPGTEWMTGNVICVDGGEDVAG